MQYSRRRPAFTLVELLVVIGIIGLLISILIPALNKARAAANALACESNLRQVGLGMLAYANANRGIVPAFGEDGDPLAPLLGPDGRGWASEAIWINAASKAALGKTYDQLQLSAMAGGPRIPIDGDHHILVCPAAPPTGPVITGTDADEVSADGYFLMHGYTVYPKQESRKTFVCYAMNNKVFGTAQTGNIAKCRRAAETVLIFEKRTNAGEAKPSDDTYYATMGGGAAKITTAPLGRFKGDWKRLTTRHKGGGYLLLSDGHVAFETLKQAMTPPVIGTNDWNGTNGYIWNTTGPATK